MMTFGYRYHDVAIAVRDGARVVVAGDVVDVAEIGDVVLVQRGDVDSPNGFRRLVRDVRVAIVDREHDRAGLAGLNFLYQLGTSRCADVDDGHCPTLGSGPR